MRRKLLTCCRTQKELEALEKEIEHGEHSGEYRVQSNLVREKTGFRCSICGTFYPMLEIHHGGETIDPRSIPKPLGPQRKFRKAADIFRGDHYYARSKKNLLRFDIDSGANAELTGEVPIMAQSAYLTVSADGRYAAAENFSGTLAVADLLTGEIIAKKRNFGGGATSRFLDHDSLICFRHDDGLYRWNFREDRQTLLWKPPAQWREADQRTIVTCHHVLEPEPGLLVFHLRAGGENHGLILDGLTPREPIRLPRCWAVSGLTDSPGPERYTLAAGDLVLVYDRDFTLVDQFPYPVLVTRSDGGGLFPISTFTGNPPRAVQLSPSGKWALLDYHTELLLMDRENGTVRWCLHSHTATTTNGGGFLDDHRFWYTWADSTYIMEI